VQNERPVPADYDAAPPQATAAERPARVFVGLKIAPDIARELAALAQPLPRHAVRPVAADDIHLTLVPPWEEPAPPAAIETLRLVAAKHCAFDLAFRHAGYGPQPRQPRLLWVECAASEELLALQAALLEAFGQHNERAYRPHVTLARIRSNGRMLARKYPIDKELSLTQWIASVELFQSPPPGQRGYRILASVLLAEAEPPQPVS
jgi:2'-5' RNA ligase